MFTKNELSSEDRFCVSELMTKKVFCASLENSVLGVQELMEWRHIRHVPVVDEKFKLKGILTHRDILHLMCSKYADVGEKTQKHLLKRIPIEEVMKKDVMTTKGTTSLHDAASILYKNKIGCLPVVNDENVLIGIITEADFVKAFVNE